MLISKSGTDPFGRLPFGACPLSWSGLEPEEETDLKREKFPNWGFTWRENMGVRELGLGFADEEKRLNLAVKTRGEL